MVEGRVVFRHEISRFNNDRVNQSLATSLVLKGARRTEVHRLPKHEA